MQIIMPRLGLTMTHGAIIEWLKAPGDQVKAEEALCVYETEKVTLELTAPEDGVLAEILAPAGTTVPAGTPVCEFRTQDEGQGIEVRAADRTVSEDARPPATSLALPVSSFATPKARALARQFGVDLTHVAGSGPDGRVQARDVEADHAAARPAPIKATPLARRIAASEGIDLRAIAGGGPEGTITREDVEQAIRSQMTEVSGQKSKVSGQGTEALEVSRSTQHAARITPTVGPGEQIVPFTALRRTIAERMSQSAFTAPHVTLMTEAEATNLVSARAQLNEELIPNVPGTSQVPGTSGPKISYNTLLAALVARALREYPGINARWEADGIRLLVEINIALAVDTERGLMTPVLRNVDRLSLPEIQRGYDELAARALVGKSLPGDFDGGTFTITNLGGLDIDGFTPIINPPQAAILGVGRIVEKPVARDGAVVIRPMVTLSLSFDHRIVDGVPAAKFLQRVKQLVERPLALLLRDA